MNPLVAKLIPYAGYPLAALMFFFWLGLKEDLAEQRAECEQQKLAAIAEAENITREALQDSLERRLADLEALALAESNARQRAELARMEAESGAEAARDIIRRLQREAENDETTVIEQACLNYNLPGSVLDGLR